MTKRKASKSGRGQYEVGWGRPPAASRFQPGQSGNPKGRPKGSKNLATVYHDNLMQKVEIRERGKVRKITAMEAIIKRHVAEALRGNLKAIEFVLAKQPEIARKAQPPPKITKETSAIEASRIYREFMRASPRSESDF